MEKLNFIKNGVLRLPPGFRFHPTDEELVVQYLKRKVFSCPLPASVIPEVDVCKADPWDLPGVWEEERYFFSTKEAKYPNGNRSNRATISGYWKATGLDKQIMTSKPNHHHVVVGMKKTLVFYKGKPPNGTRTDWIMHEYRLVTNENTTPCNYTPQQPKTTTTQSSMMGMENWVICRIFLKKRNTKNEDEDDNVESCNNKKGIRRMKKKKKNMKPVFYNFLRTKDEKKSDLNVVPCSSSSGSSVVTDVSSNESEEHEGNSSCCNDSLEEKCRKIGRE